jgi:hypothetical protein
VKIASLTLTSHFFLSMLFPVLILTIISRMNTLFQILYVVCMNFMGFARWGIKPFWFRGACAAGQFAILLAFWLVALLGHVLNHRGQRFEDGGGYSPCWRTCS